MRISGVRVLLICCVSLMFSAEAYSLPVTWTLSAVDPTYPPLFGFGGTFTYDADTNTISSLVVQDCIHCVGEFQCDITANCTASVSDGGTLVLFSSLSNFIYSNLRLEVASPLTDAGGVLALIPGSGGSSGPGTFSSGVGSAFYVTPGNGNGFFYPIESGTISAAPEPGYRYIAGLLLLTMLCIRGRRRLRLS